MGTGGGLWHLPWGLKGAEVIDIEASAMPQSSGTYARFRPFASRDTLPPAKEKSRLRCGHVSSAISHPPGTPGNGAPLC
jgi:hypothetical protein